MSVVAVIPARLDSTRFPGKPLADICGLPMIVHCYLRSVLAELVDEVYVATCDEEIASVANSFGARVIMTSNQHINAIDRTAEAVRSIRQGGIAIEAVVLVQGDEPLLDPAYLDALVDSLRQAPDAHISNIMVPFASYEEFQNPNNVKVVTDSYLNAMYMSREPIPSAWRGWQPDQSMMQTGLFGFRVEALEWFAGAARTPLELIESVDMVRVLQHGRTVRMVPMSEASIGVDTPADLESARRLMATDATFAVYRSALTL